jgi:uncharacterized SAM-binding protein YcdF (DUF218 family)
MTAILILGAAVWPDGPSPTLKRRTAHGAALYHKGLGDIVMPCGGLGRHPPAEANVMADLLRKAGIPPEVILPEDRSTNTRENIRFAREILEQTGDLEVVLVSDAYHLPRARLIARREGLNVTTSAPPDGAEWTWPQIRGWLREGPALLACWLRLR